MRRKKFEKLFKKHYTKFKKAVIALLKSPSMEGAVMIFFLLVLDIFFYAGDRFIYLTPHPFWVPLLLIICRYGVFHSIVVSVLCSLALYSNGIPQQEIGQEYFDYLVFLYWKPFLWFMAASFLGQLTEMNLKKAQVLKEELDDSIKKEKAIEGAYIELKLLKEDLETKMITQEKGPAEIYDALKELEMLNPSELLMSIETVVRTVIEPKKMSVFSHGPNGFEAISCVDWEEDEIYRTRFTHESKLYQHIMGNKKPLCAVREADFKILGPEGILATPLFNSDTGEVIGLIKIEEIDFEQLSITTVELFEALGNWLSSVYTNAMRFEATEEKLRKLENAAS